MVYFLSLHYRHCLGGSDVAGNDGACGEMWQSRSCTQDPCCAGNAVCTDVLMHTCWGILQCGTMLSLLKLSIASLITNAGALFVIPRWEALWGWDGGGCSLSYSGSLTALFYWDKELWKLSISLKEAFKHELSCFYKQYLSSFFTPSRGAAWNYEPHAQEMTPGTLHFHLVPHRHYSIFVLLYASLSTMKTKLQHSCSH